jgi:glucokinase
MKWRPFIWHIQLVNRPASIASVADGYREATGGERNVSGSIAAIDLGGTHVRAAVVSESGEVLGRLRRRTPTDAPRPDVLPAMIKEVAGGGPVARVVVGVPGIIDHDAEALERAPNLPQCWIPWLTGTWLAEAIGAPVSLANDCDLAAVGEASFGAGQGYRDVIYVTISTGVGAGMVVDRSVVRGQHSGGEIGHTIVDIQAARAGRPCTVEELGAGPAIAAAAARAGLAERDAELAELVRSGHPVASSIWNEAIEVVAFGVVNLAWLLAPQVVVIGGGVGNNRDLVLPTITRVLAERGPAVDEPIPVVGAALGDDAALLGAATWFQAIGRRDLDG